MKRKDYRHILAAALLLAGPLAAQVTFNPVPTRVLGHPLNTLVTSNPNLVEGRELLAPQGVAVDTSSNPPILYVADTLNNRVLAWRDATSFANGAMADLVIGQKDRFSTFTLGPGSSFSGGLTLPTGLAVDGSGNLFVADSGNNRILRFSGPFSNPDPVKQPDLVIGQSTLTNGSANTGGRSEKTLALFTGGTLVAAQMTFDSQGNLYCSDPLNSRVLRYPAASVSSTGAAFGPSADLVLGQVNFTVRQDPASATDLSKLAGPSGLAFDAAGRLFVADPTAFRVVVWTPPFSTGTPAQRLLGGVNPQPPSPANLNAPEGVFVVNGAPYVVDTGNHRILGYDRYDSWPSNSAVQAKSVIGQADYSGIKSNRGSILPSTNNVALNQPVTAVFAGRLFVADSQNHRLLVLPNATSDSLAAPPAVLGQDFPDANAPNLTEGREFFFGQIGAGIAVDRNSDPPHLYVADTLNNRVLCYRDARNLRWNDKATLVIGQPDFAKTVLNFPNGTAAQPTASNLSQPTGVAVDSAGNVYVADTGNGRVLRFPAPFQNMQSQPSADLVLGKLTFTQSILTAPDPSPRNMGDPYGLAFTVDGHLLVSDRAFNRVLFFRKPTGGDFTSGMDAEKVFGQSGFFTRDADSLPNRLRNPRHISTDTDDRLYVCDTGNGRVLIFDRTPVAGSDPNAAVILDAPNNPQGIFVSAVTGEIWVADTQKYTWDTQNNQLQRYRKFDDLILNPNPEVTLNSPSELPLTVTLDSFGNMMAAYSTNRIATFFPAMTPSNAASYGFRIAPGMIAALYPLDEGSRRFGEQTASATSLPLPTELADVQVLVNDQPAPLFFVSPNQINFMVPMSAPSSGAVDMEVVRKSSGQIVAVGCSATRVGQKADGTTQWKCTSAQVPMNVASPGVFTTSATGTGQIAANNVRSIDGGYYGDNSPTNPVARGDIIVLYATGQGFVPDAPPDGNIGGAPTPEPPRVIIGTDFVADSDILYSGLAPSLVGVWQLNVKVPERVAPSDKVLVVILHKSIPSNDLNDSQRPGKLQTTIAVKQ